ncbi:MAG: hypothetical protein WC969_04025 [Elusimicrobiota bacterium]|jgi:hypothetical protein
MRRARYTPLLAALLLLAGPAQSWAQAVARTVPQSSGLVLPVSGLRIVAPANASGSLTAAPLGRTTLPTLTLSPAALPQIAAAADAPRTAAARSALRLGLRILPGAKSSAGRSRLAASAAVETAAPVTARGAVEDIAASVLAEKDSPERGGAALGVRYDGATFRRDSADPVVGLPSEDPLAAAQLLPAEAGPASASAEPSVEGKVSLTASEEKDRAKVLSRYLWGTRAFKVGMEALGLAVPLLALTTFGSAAIAAGMAAGWGLSQAAFGIWGGSLIDRNPPGKILTRAMYLEALTGASLIALFMVDKFLPAVLPFAAFNPVAVLVLYSLAGGFVGMADVARQVVPPSVFGEDEKAVKAFYARTHIAYEVAGVLGAALAGLTIKYLGIAAVLAIHPPMYLLAALIFSKLRLPQAHPVVKAAPDPAAPRGLKAVWADLKEGARTIHSSPMIMWGAAAIILPLIVHRLMESLLIPVFAKAVLLAPAKAAWMTTASNAGELLGALVLSRSMKKDHPPHSAFWVRLLALGLVGLWAFSISPTLWTILPFITLSRVTWAASDLSLRGKLQSAISPDKRGRTFGLITAVTFVLIVASSLGLGMLMDAFPISAVYIGVNVVLTLLALVLLKASFPLAEKKVSLKKS